MINIQEIKETLKRGGSKLVYQSLDGLNWKQLTFNDINSNLDYITSYLRTNKIKSKNILCCTKNCLDSFLLESALSNLDSKMFFASTSTLRTIEFNQEFDLIIIDHIDEINMSPTLKKLSLSKEFITIQNFRKTKETGDKIKSLQNILKIGLLNKRDLDKKKNEFEFKLSQTYTFANLEGLFEFTITDFANQLDKIRNVFGSINVHDFSTSLYTEQDSFSKVVNFIFLLEGRKFSSNSSIDSFIRNSNELMPKNIIIDAKNLSSMLNISGDNDKKLDELLGSKVERIITYEFDSDLYPNKILQKFNLINYKR
jgi:hypothetical protein